MHKNKNNLCCLIPECLSHLVSFHSTICSVAFAYYDFLNITKNVKNSFFSNGTPYLLLHWSKTFSKKKRAQIKNNITERVINIAVRIVFHGIQWPAKKISHHLNVSVKKALITHLDFDVTQK
jgi:hypothetical protein